MTGGATPQPAAPPASVIIHDLDQARQVLAAAVRTERPVQLVSAPGAGAYLGPALFKQLIDQARAAQPAAQATSCLDCGDEPGTAMNAIRHEIEAISLSAEPNVLSKVGDAARQVGVRLTPRPAPLLDMAEQGAAGRLDAWLSGDMNS